MDTSAALSKAPAGQVSHEIERCLPYLVLMLGVDRATVGQISPADGLVYTTHEWARDGVTHTRLRINTGEILPWLTSKIFAGETIVLHDVRELAPYAVKDLEYAQRAKARSNLTVPMKIGGSVLGALSLDTATRVERWPERTVRQAQLLAEVFGNAIEREHSALEALRLAREMRRSSRATSMGELMASLAHELNQPLGAILSNAQAAHRFLTAKEPDLEEVRAAIEDIVNDNSRAVEIVRSVRALFRRDQVPMLPLDLGQVLLEAERLLSLDARSKGISIRSDFSFPLPTLVANRTQLLEVLMNLATNAFDSICEDERAPRVVELLARSEGGHVRVAVRDFGKGIAPEIMPRLFDAFFTTKPKGMGIGLRIARSIVENHGGRLWAEANAGRGATLIFELPVSAHGHDDQ